ncbi:TlpA family protein disulfide reductase [Crocinitomix algicola]|uniref:TlpA family protein disulfide reductase n=1 Tax=Crocinitomix algicola TaxID=1740263 RepID=UPI00082A263A|nr:TlpA disulfide reductase family protein [Crocinitomix algicola]
MKLIHFFFIILFTIPAIAKNTKIKTGNWHVEFQLSAKKNLPVTIDVIKIKKSYLVYIINGKERIELTNINLQNDSLYIPFATFDSELRAQIKSKNKILGNWHNYSKGPNYKIPFTAEFGIKKRFPYKKEKTTIPGKWEVTFNYEKQAEKAIGLFHYSSVNNLNEIEGTFLTETGDYRFLEGIATKDSLYLSTFDGSHAFLFSAQLKQDTLWGEFLSGTHYKSKWYAIKNENFELKHPDSLTYVINDIPLELSLTSSDNLPYTYPNKDTEDKVTLIQIMGSWCPNCLDESRYLAQQKQRYGDELEIIAVTFEMPEKLEDRIQKIRNYKAVLGLNYTFLMGGSACKSCASELFPQLNNIISFPTLIFIDKKGKIRKVHTGFNGPGTGIYYENFVERTDAFLNTLIKE